MRVQCKHAAWCSGHRLTQRSRGHVWRPPGKLIAAAAGIRTGHHWQAHIDSSSNKALEDSRGPVFGFEATQTTAGVCKEDGPNTRAPVCAAPVICLCTGVLAAALSFPPTGIAAASGSLELTYSQGLQARLPTSTSRPDFTQCSAPLLTIPLNDPGCNTLQRSVADTVTVPVSTAPISSALAPLISEDEALTLPRAPPDFPPLPSIAMPDFQRATLSNGLRVVMLEDHEVPLVRGTLYMRGGTRASPPNKVGLASMSMAVQRAGGSVAHPAGALDSQLDLMAAGVEAGAGPQALSLDFYSSTEDLPQVLGLWAEVLRQPALPEDKLRLIRDQFLNNIEHANDDATAQGRRELMKLMYGRDSIYARQATKAGVSSITTADIRQFLSVYERPDNGLLGVVGDFNPPDLIALLEKELGSWKPAEGQPQSVPTPAQEADVLSRAPREAGKVYLIDRPGLAQASVAVSEPGVQLLNPDAYALDVLATSLNSFGGQLFDQLRSREGLAYSVYGTWDTPADHVGVFVGGGQTSAPAEFLTGLRRVLDQATREPRTPEALEDARAEVLNAFVFNFASKAAQLQRTLVYDLLDLPPDLLFRFRDAVTRVSAEDVLGAAQRHLHPSQQVTVIVGDAQTFLPQLKRAGFAPVLLKPVEE